jgi:hypothetical protein
VVAVQQPQPQVTAQQLYGHQPTSLTPTVPLYGVQPPIYTHPSYGYPGTYNQFNTYNSYGPNFYNPNHPNYYGQSHPQLNQPSYGYQPGYAQPQSYPVPSPSPPYNPYANVPQIPQTSQISLGVTTFSG